MDLGVHLPLMRFGEEPLSFGRLARTVDAARESGFAAISANDHLVFGTPWLDGPTALASVVDRSGAMTLATQVALAVVPGPGAPGQGARRSRRAVRRGAGGGGRAGLVGARLRRRRVVVRRAVAAVRGGGPRAARAAGRRPAAGRRALLPIAGRAAARAAAVP